MHGKTKQSEVYFKVWVTACEPAHW